MQKRNNLCVKFLKYNRWKEKPFWILVVGAEKVVSIDADAESINASKEMKKKCEVDH